MRKTVLLSIVIIVTSMPAWGKDKEVQRCILPDFLCIGLVEKHWEMHETNGGNPLFTVTAKDRARNEYFNRRYSLERVPRNKFPRRYWQYAFQRHLRKIYRNAKVQSRRDAGEHRATYSYVDHYLPIDGMAIARDDGAFIYIVDCQRQGMGLNENQSIGSWCESVYKNISWPSQRAVERSDGDYLVRWSQFKFDEVGLEREYEDLQKRAQDGVIDEGLVKDYVGLIITEGLYSPSPRSSESALEELAVLKNITTAYGDSVLNLIIDIHEDYLKGKESHLDKKLGQLVRIQPSAPYWLMSRWIEGSDRDAAMTFATRSTIAYSSPISAYTQAALLKKTRSSVNVEEILRKEKTNNTMIYSLLASDALERGDTKAAKKYIKKAEHRDPDNIDILFAKARMYAASAQDNEGDYDKADAIYHQLSQNKSLSRENQITLYYEWADLTYDPDRKIDYYGRVIALRKNSPQAYYLLGRVYMLEKRNIREAIAQFKQYLRYAPYNDPKAKELRQLIWKLETQMYG